MYDNRYQFLYYGLFTIYMLMMSASNSALFINFMGQTDWFVNQMSLQKSNEIIINTNISVDYSRNDGAFLFFYFLH